MKGELPMESLTHRKRACIMIMDQDLDFGIKLADWLAAHRYQVVLVRSLQAAITEFPDIRPHAVLIGLAQTGSAFPIHLQELLRAIETGGSPVPVITMGNPTSGALANLLYGGVIRHVHLSIRPSEFAYIGRLLRAELNAATASPSADPRHSSSRLTENRVQARTTFREAATWIG